jgi:hypothetical protein
VATIPILATPAGTVKVVHPAVVNEIVAAPALAG